MTTQPRADSLEQRLGPLLAPVLGSLARDDAPGASGASRPQQDPPPVDYSDAYALRATIHRDASYATVPLFLAEYAVGRSLYSRSPGSSSESLRSAHGALATGIAGLFAVNAVTGVWNLWDARKDPAGRTRRYIHAALMLASTAGFVATGALAPEDEDEFGAMVDQSRRTLHRNVAIASMSTALAGYLLMWIWKD